MMKDEGYEEIVYEEPEDAAELKEPERTDAVCPPVSKRKGGFAVLLTQSAVCAVLLGAALAVRMMGGGISEWWHARLGEAMADNRVVEWIFGAWPDDDASEEPSEASVLPDDATREVSSPPPASGSESGVELPFASDSLQASAVAHMTAVEATEQTAAISRDLPLPACLPLVSGVMTSAYGEREHPISGEDSFHTGWDIAAEEGTPLAAMYDATVTETGSGGSYGNYVVMRVSDRLSFLYAHCSELLVSEGDEIRAGQTVARVGSTGVSTGNHLHLEVLVDGETCDPSAVLAREVYPS